MSNKNQKKSTKAITPPADISQSEQSGGVNIERSTANISGDITGRDKTVIHVEKANIFVNQNSSADTLIPKAHQRRIFISYSHHLESDKKLATFLNDFLRNEGHIPFIDKSMRTGTAWLEEIDKQIKSSDLLVVLLSKDSADSEMIKSEIQRAYEYRKLQGRPHTLPIRINYEGLLPYAISAFISHLHYSIWNNETDNEKVGQDILLALSGELPAKMLDVSAPITLEQITISEDGRRTTKIDGLHPPLPEFDPRFLDDLEAPGGTVKQNDRFYIERDADRQLKREIAKSGTTITIRAPRQTGKSSLLVRGLHFARSNAKIINIDLQGIDRDHLATPDVFLHHLANLTAYKMNISSEKIEKIWNSPLGSQDKLTRVFEDIILPSNEQHIVFSFDEADRLLETSYHSDFFALLRSWHNARALDEQWQKINVVMVISTEPYLLIAETNQSPFNVGLKIYLEDFSREQVSDLNVRHGSPITAKDFGAFMSLLAGQPYLTRKALYTLAIDKWDWTDLVNNATKEQSPFSDHLRRQHWLLNKAPDLQEPLKQIIRSNKCDNNSALLRLLQAGIIKGSGDAYSCRCELYSRYFRERLL